MIALWGRNLRFFQPSRTNSKHRFSSPSENPLLFYGGGID
jgi:hypothetical protein